MEPNIGTLYLFGKVILWFWIELKCFCC
jgi:hypothetical protein